MKRKYSDLNQIYFEQQTLRKQYTSMWDYIMDILLIEPQLNLEDNHSAEIQFSYSILKHADNKSDS